MFYFALYHQNHNMIFIKNKVILTLLFGLLFQHVNAASFDKYFPKLIKFEGNGFGIHKPIWGNKVFTKKEAYNIYKKNYWNKYNASLFTNQRVAEVLIDQIINAGIGKECVNIKAFEAVIGVIQDGYLSKADIQVANNFTLPEQIINPFSNYRLHYYRSRKNFSKYPGWTTRAKSFMVTDSIGNLLADYLVLPKMLIKDELQDCIELFKAELLVKK